MAVNGAGSPGGARRASSRVPRLPSPPLPCPTRCSPCASWWFCSLFAGWIHREQAQVVDYLVEENRVLREHLGDRRLRLNDDQRRRLATKGKALGRSLLAKVATIVPPRHDPALAPHADLGEVHERAKGSW